MEFSKELIEKAKACKTAEELLALAKENGYELSTEEAELFLQDFAEGELADVELDNVSGGVEGCKPANPYERIYFKSEEAVQFIFNIGDEVEAFPTFWQHHTVRCKVTARRTNRIAADEWLDVYYLSKLDGADWFSPGWYTRDSVEK